MTDGSGRTAWEYTPRGEVEKESKVITGSGTYITKWGYHPDGSMRWMQYPDNEKLTYTYLAQKTLKTVQTSLDSGLYYVYSTDYDAANRIVQQKRGGSNNLLMQFSYFAWDTPNGNGRLKQIKAGTVASPTSLLDLRYYTGTNTPEYDPVGNIKKIYDYKMGSPQTQTFGYDNLDRLTSAQASGGTNGNYASETYGYDPNTGNLQSKAGVTYYYNDSNHAHAVTSLSNGNTYVYDSNGNQKTRTISGTAYTLSYDAENRLVKVTWSVSNKMEFTFDGDGNRVKSVLNTSTTTSFIGTYYEVTGSAITKYYYADTTRVAMRSSSGVRYIFGDHLGSTSITAEGSGNNPIRQLYKAWGEVRYSSGSLPTKYAYTGQYSYASASEIGLLYYVARFYDPVLGRYSSPDSIIPIESQGIQAWDRFAYVSNSPLNYIDPTGHGCEDLPAGSREACIKARSYDPKFDEWYSGNYSGCTLCHYAHAQNKSILTNNELEVADQNIREWALIGYSPIIIPAIGLGGIEMINTVFGFSTTAVTVVATEESTRRGITVLGRFPSYLKVADDVCGKVLSVPKDVWEKLDSAQQWALNQKFLDEAIARGDYFYLASKWSDAQVGTFYRRELEYLFNLGYTLSLHQNYLIPPPGH